MTRKFPSIQHPTKYGYLYESCGAYSSREPQLDNDFRMFETYGDGLTQHSGDWPITRDFAIDYFASLAAALLTDEELADSLGYKLNRAISDEQITFAASVKFKADADGSRYEKKPRYYSLDEMKISSSPSKAYDKRYHQIEPSDDGTAEALMRRLTPEYCDSFRRYLNAEAVRDWCFASPRDENRPWCAWPAEMLAWGADWKDDRDRSRKLRDAIQACRDITKAYSLRANAERFVDGMKEATLREITKLEADRAIGHTEVQEVA